MVNKTKRKDRIKNRTYRASNITNRAENGKYRGKSMKDIRFWKKREK
jgi:hypothetical protein